MLEYRRIFSYVVPYWRRLAVGLLGLVSSSLITLALPYAISQLVDSVFLTRNYAQLNLIALALAALFILQGFVSFAYRYYLKVVAQRTVADLRLDLHRHLLQLPLRFFTNNRVGELISRMSNDAAVVQGIIVDAPVAFIRQIITVLGGIALILWLNWQLSLIILVMIPPLVLMASRFGKKLKRLSSEAQDRLADATITLEELLSGIRVVKSFAQENYEGERYRTEIEKGYDVAVRREYQRSIFVALFTGLGFGAMTFLIWFGGRQVIAGQITPGELVGFLIYFLVVSAPLTEFASVWGRLQEGVGAARRIFEIIDTPPEPGLLLEASPDGSAHGYANGSAQQRSCVSIRMGYVLFSQVSFSYMTAESQLSTPNPDGNDNEAEELPAVLVDVNIEAEPGQVVALVGYSGSGKTTLVNLIPRFYDPTQGRIQIDDTNIRTIPVRTLRSQIGLVPQETFLFGGTIRDNIAYGNLNAPAEAIYAAAEAAYAHQFIDQLPHGFDTVVGEKGIKLSAGQRQRIAIARAILKDPRILILDEATSALDSESERWVQAALDRLMEGRTSFVIAHRLSTIQRANQILVMNAGQIVERGTHQELINRGGHYSKLHNLQFQDALESA